MKTAMVVVALAAATTAAAFSGTATLAGKSKLAVHGCGADRGTFAATVTVAADGTWTALATDGPSAAGTWTPVGRAGRKVRFTFDAASLAALGATVIDEVSMLCHVTATLTAVHPHALTLILNRKLTRATLVISYGFSGRAGGRSGTASYHVVGHGSWTPGP
jgi:hypothetical protein